MKRLLQASLLIATATGFTACTGPNPPPPGGGRGRGRSLDVPPRYGVPQEQTQYFDGVDLSKPDANAAAVQPPNPNAPTTGDNVTAPPTTDNPTAPPPVTVTPPNNTSAPAPAPTPAPAPAEIPYATRIPGKPGFVKSPFDPNGQAIDVRDFQSGQKAKCPYTGKIFRVP
ncbi:hypothetical protein [Prosthecobacter sp.]|uniref:hypothetical protein n=1 Tax=Prosthecobacter sp. TaxID=1965333 RepID=UPI003784C480